MLMNSHYFLAQLPEFHVLLFFLFFIGNANHTLTGLLYCCSENGTWQNRTFDMVKCNGQYKETQGTPQICCAGIGSAELLYSDSGETFQPSECADGPEIFQQTCCSEVDQ